MTPKKKPHDWWAVHRIVGLPTNYGDSIIYLTLIMSEL
ncbi:MAG: hypothetical protein ACJAW8_000617 [Oleispira sp.]|jgi:hypothetical protein